MTLNFEIAHNACIQNQFYYLAIIEVPAKNDYIIGQWNMNANITKRKEQPNLPINAKLYYQTALDLGLPVHFYSDEHCMQVKLENKYYYFKGSITPLNLRSDSFVSDNKAVMNKLLKDAGIPVANAALVSREDFNKSTWGIGNLKFPLVAKPTSFTFGGMDVLCNIKNYELLEKHLAFCFEMHEFVSVEEFHGGLRSYRALLLDNKVIGLLERIPARVFGDGVHNISELMAIENERRKPYIGKVSIDELSVNEEYAIRMEELGITLETIPKKGEVVMLCYCSNALWGGTMEALDISLICEENIDLICRAAKRLNLKLVGFDLACEDISKPIEQPGSTGIIIEANSNPDISIHENPLYGEANRVSLKIFESILKRHPRLYAKLWWKYFR
ncbi:MAG: UDP-N-acetylmuramyl peptide synthase [Candidatus Berkiella sp.]